MRLFPAGRPLGVTLIELLIVVVIIVILTVVGGISLNSRMATSRLEEATRTLVSDINYARSSALFKGCTTRLIFCMDKDCTAAGKNVSSQSSYIGTSSGPARYYATLRMSQSVTSTDPCFNVNAIGSAADGFDRWDFDRKPQAIPRGLAFSDAYNASGILDFSDWSDSTSAAATNSLWFSSSTGATNIPVAGNTVSNGDTIAFQVQFDDCDPGASSGNENCLAYFVTIGSGGVVNMVKCNNGTRGAFQSDNCF